MTLRVLVTVLCAIPAFVFLGGCGGGCPSIGCRPKVDLFYDRSIAGSYVISVTVDHITLQSTCPAMAQQFLPENDPPRVDSCDSDGITISGIDLGHGDNRTLGASLSIDGSSSISVTASLTTIVNGRDCALVCYVHSGHVPD